MKSKTSKAVVTQLLSYHAASCGPNVSTKASDKTILVL